MLETLRNAFKIKDVRRRIYYVLLMLVIVRIGSQMPIPGVTSKMLADTVRAKHPGKEVVYCSSRLELNRELEKMVGEGDLLLTMGAGDVTTVGPEFIEYLTAKKDA